MLYPYLASHLHFPNSPTFPMQALLGLGPSFTHHHLFCTLSALPLEKPSPCLWVSRCFRVQPGPPHSQVLVLRFLQGLLKLYIHLLKELLLLCVGWKSLVSCNNRCKGPWSSVYLALEAGRASLESRPTPGYQEVAPAFPLSEIPLAVLQPGSFKTSFFATLATKRSRESIACLSHFCLRKENCASCLLIFIYRLHDILLAKPLWVVQD